MCVPDTRRSAKSSVVSKIEPGLDNPNKNRRFTWQCRHWHPELLALVGLSMDKVMVKLVVHWYTVGEWSYKKKSSVGNIGYESQNG